MIIRDDQGTDRMVDDDDAVLVICRRQVQFFQWLAVNGNAWNPKLQWSPDPRVLDVWVFDVVVVLPNQYSGDQWAEVQALLADGRLDNVERIDAA